MNTWKLSGNDGNMNDNNNKNDNNNNNKLRALTAPWYSYHQSINVGKINLRMREFYIKWYTSRSIIEKLKKKTWWQKVGHGKEYLGGILLDIENFGKAHKSEQYVALSKHNWDMPVHNWLPKHLCWRTLPQVQTLIRYALFIN